MNPSRALRKPYKLLGVSELEGVLRMHLPSQGRKLDPNRTSLTP